MRWALCAVQVQPPAEVPQRFAVVQALQRFAEVQY
jgi:hypothetical protein